jgi:hypothetical protein
MTLGVVLLLWPVISWLLEKRKTAAEPVAASAGAAAVDREQ